MKPPPHTTVPAADRLYATHPAFAPDRRRARLLKKQAPHWRRSVYIQLAVFAAVLLLWPLPLPNPVKLLVVVFHEMYHTLAAWGTGGVVFGMAIDPGGAGVTLGMGGDRLIILTAGYLGSLLIGWLLYALSATWDTRDVWSILCILALGSVLFGWLNDFTAFFGYFSLGLLLAGFGLSAAAKKFVLLLVATSCCLYPILDVFWEFIFTTEQGFTVRGETVGSDAAQLAALTGLPLGLIIAFWILLGLGAACRLICWAARKDAETEVKHCFFRLRLRLRRRPDESSYDPLDPDSIPEYHVRA